MPNYTVKCPHCGTIKTASQNMHYRCSGCNALIKVGNNGEIKETKPAKWVNTTVDSNSNKK